MNEVDKSTNMPTVLVVLFALLGLAFFPQTQGGRGGSSSSLVPEASGPSEGSGTRKDSAEGGQDNGQDSPLKLLEQHGCRLQSNKIPENVRCLIVMVPEPGNTSVSHEFDSTLATVLRAAESEGFVAERNSFPWSPHPPEMTTASVKPAGNHSSKLLITVTPGRANKSSKSWPGAVLCRRVVPWEADKKEYEHLADSLLLLLLVPETPARGVDRSRLDEAIRIVSDCQKPDERIRIVGPFYSGSFPSLAQAIKNMCGEIAAQRPSFTIINGSALLPPPAEMIETLFGLEVDRVEFWSTVYSQRTLVNNLTEYLISNTIIRKQRSAVALLVEAGSAFGLVSRAQRDQKQHNDKDFLPDPDLFQLPMGISRIRKEYTARGYYQSNEPLRLAAPERLSLQAMTDRMEDSDLAPVFSPGTAAVEGELALSQWSAPQKLVQELC